MSRIRDDVQKGKLFFALLANDENSLDAVRERIGREFSHIDVSSPIVDSADGGFYVEEMGTGLRRQFIATRTPVFVPQLVEIKRSAARLEEEFIKDGRRRVNIDPGYVTTNKVVRATSRDAAHRLYVNRGIFNESVLILNSENQFQKWPWTDPDFVSGAASQFFQELRQTVLLHPHLFEPLSPED